MRGQKKYSLADIFPKGKTQEGINYCIHQEEVLKVFLNDGEVPLDNNVTEGALLSLCLHKNAWKLIDSIHDVKSSVFIYSIMKIAKANNLNPFRYLTHILTVLKDHKYDTDYSFMNKICFYGPIGYRRSVGANLKQLICKPDRRKWRPKNGASPYTIVFTASVSISYVVLTTFIYKSNLFRQ